MDGAPSVTRTHSRMFASLACQPLHHSKRPGRANSNLRNVLLRCGTRPNECGTQWDSTHAWRFASQSSNKIIKVRRTRHAGHCWRSRDGLISDELQWTPSHGRTKVRRPARTYIQQLCEDTGCSPEDLPEAMNEREGWRERVRVIRADGTIWWWWWLSIVIIL